MTVVGLVRLASRVGVVHVARPRVGVHAWCLDSIRALTPRAAGLERSYHNCPARPRRHLTIAGPKH